MIKILEAGYFKSMMYSVCVCVCVWCAVLLWWCMVVLVSCVCVLAQCAACVGLGSGVCPTLSPGKVVGACARGVKK